MGRGTCFGQSVNCVPVPAQSHPCLLQGRGRAGRATSTLGPWPSGSSEQERPGKGGGLSHAQVQGGAFTARSSFWQDRLVQVALDGWPR